MSTAPFTSTASKVFKASRWTRGNFLFPTHIEVGPERVLRIKPRFFGSSEESIPITKVASVLISTGMLWSDIRIDSTGGSNPILSPGPSKADAVALRNVIDPYQQRMRQESGVSG